MILTKNSLFMAFPPVRTSNERFRLPSTFPNDSGKPSYEQKYKNIIFLNLTKFDLKSFKVKNNNTSSPKLKPVKKWYLFTIHFIYF